jgi:ubiquinone/menaquinone biosynthesis C-methylase UbiE
MTTRHQHQNPRYIDIPELREAYREGKNIIETINRKYGLNTNTSETIEISYDLQAGSYIAYFKDHTDYAKRSAAERAACVIDAFPDGETILDCGCGELTNSALLFSKLNGGGYKKFFCFDLSWSRVFLGKEFFLQNVSAAIAEQTSSFVADMANIPLSDHSIDVITTEHALEPNHGRETELLRELLRVARRGLVLFEPSFELGSKEQRARMEKHGYIRGLPEVLRGLGEELERYELLKNYANPLNRSAAYVVRKKESKGAICLAYVDPVSKTNLTREGSFYYSRERGVVYPVIRDIPVLKESAQVLATAFGR